MLVNPGGPGAAGRSTAAIGDYVPGGVGSSYDWIGFDPRGVAASSPSLRCRRGYFGDDRPSYVPHRAWMTRFWIAKTRNYSAGCARHRREAHLAATPDHAGHRARHGVDPPGPGRDDPQLLRLLLRQLPRPGLRDPVPQPRRSLRARRRRQPWPGLVRRQPRPGPRLRGQHQRVLPLPGGPPARVQARSPVARHPARVQPRAAPAGAPPSGARPARGPTSWATRCSARPTTSSTGWASVATTRRWSSTTVAPVSTPATAGRTPSTTTPTRSTPPCSAATHRGRTAPARCATPARSTASRRSRPGRTPGSTRPA